MNEFLTGLSSGQPLLWAVFVIGVMAATALSLSAFWGGLFRIASVFRRERPRAEGDDVLP